MFGDYGGDQPHKFNLPEQERKTGFRLVVPINKRSLFKDKVR